MVEKIGPYRVYERLGVGGMGEVYKAYDDRLDRWVAIKRIRPDREDAEDNRERFKREARATARLNHPSIVHLYGIFQDGDNDCIVMEYVDGKTLDQILAEEGAQDPLRVASLGHEISSGLAEAHANGILHRDLKAENIMITPRGRAKILDFGLAKPILRSELDPVLTGKGQLVGTSRAMSPEYVSGEAVDHRSDLFSLGVLLYETLTGQSPFKAHNTLATLKQVMLHKQTPAKQASPHVPPELSDLIDQLLEKDPENRPQNAHEVALSFGRLTGQLSSGIIDAPPGLGSGVGRGSSTLTTFTASDTVLDLRPRRRWIGAVIAIAVLVVAAFIAGLFLKREEPEPELPPEERVSLVLADFQNNTEEVALGASIGEAFRTVLEQSRAHTVLSRGEIRNALSRMQMAEETKVHRDLGREIAQREGAQRLIAGSVSKFGSSYSVIVDVVEPVDDRTVFSANGTAKTQDQLLETIEKLGQDVRRHLGESAVEIESTAVSLAKVSTPDLEALKAYTLGVQKIAEIKDAEAVSFLERALLRDPGFAMANAKLGVLYSFEGDKDNALLHLRGALENQDRLTEVQKFYVNGWIARWTGTAQDVIDNWALMRELHPENSAAAYNLGAAHWLYNNNFEAASEAFRHSAASSQGEGLAALGWCQLVLGNLARAEESFGQSTEPDRYLGLVSLYATRRQYAEAEQLLAEAPVPPVEATLHQGLLLADRGQLEEALGLLDSALNKALAEPDQGRIATHIRTDKGAILELLDRREEAQKLVKDLLSSESSMGISNNLSPESDPITALAVLGKIVARLGDLALAQEVEQALSSKISETSPDNWRVAFLVLQGEVALAQQDIDTAILHFDDALAIAEYLPAHDGLAEAYARQGKASEALEELEQIVAQRGRAYGECSSSCYGRLVSIHLTNLAHLRSAEILSDAGQVDAAASHLAKFRQYWPELPADSTLQKRYLSLVD